MGNFTKYIRNAKEMETVHEKIRNKIAQEK